MAAANTMIDERDGNGRFLPGHPGGPGRPRREVEQAYLTTLRDCVPPDEWRAICLTAVAKAKAGDRYARQWLSDLLLANVEVEGIADRLEALEVRLRLR